MKTDIGNMKHRVTLQTVSRSVDAMGGTSNSFTSITSFWAQKIPVKSDELFKYGQVQNHNIFKFIVRYRTDINQTCRLTDADSNIYRVTGVRDIDAEHKYLEILTEQIGI